jgi:hypothetical protein
MNQRQTAGGIEMGMRILIRRSSMGGPSGMTDAEVALDRMGLTGFR